MNTRTMEGLVGAGMNMKIRDTPMRVYKEAEREGDIGKMEQAMGYVNELGTRAWECKSQAEEGMAEEAEEMKEKEKLEQEKAIAERREEKREQKEEAENLASICTPPGNKESITVAKLEKSTTA